MISVLMYQKELYMSEYTNLLTDFPGRVLEVLNFCELKLGKDKEVTYHLMALSSGFVIPHERLNPDHPLGDAFRYENLDIKVKKFLNKEISKGVFKETCNFSLWRYTKITRDQLIDHVESWNLEKSDSPTKIATRKILSCIRNSLAHGNVFVTGDPIENVVFASKSDREGTEFWVLMIPVTELRSFTKTLLEFFRDNHQLSVQVIRSLQAA